MQQEIPLSGGNTTTGVVRLGATVRKPWSGNSSGVLEYMRILRERNIDLPKPLGKDAKGRMVTEFVPGSLALKSSPLTCKQLMRVGELVRSIHDASLGLDADALGLDSALLPVDQPDLVCHGDLTPWNLLIGERWVFIDWDGAALSTRLWDLAYSVQTFTLNDATADPVCAAERLCAFVDGYGADPSLRSRLVEVLPQRAWAMHNFLRTSYDQGREPWASMYSNFHGAYWRGIGLFLQKNMPIWQEALSPFET